MPTTRFTTDVEVCGNDEKLYVCHVKVTYSYDAGVWYDSNGEGCPPSSDLDWSLDHCVDEDGVRYNELPDCVCEDDIAEAIEFYIENEEL